MDVGGPSVHLKGCHLAVRVKGESHGGVDGTVFLPSESETLADFPSNPCHVVSDMVENMSRSGKKNFAQLVFLLDAGGHRENPPIIRPD